MAQTTPAVAPPSTGTGTGPEDPDPAKTILDPLTGIGPKAKALAWDTFYQSPDPETFRTRLGAIPLPQETKAALWDAKYNAGTGGKSLGGVSTPPPRAPNTIKPGAIDPNPPGVKGWVNTALDWAPVAGAAIGSFAGTGLGVPTGGAASVPLAVAGAGLGGSIGESVKEVGQELLGTRDAQATTAEILKAHATQFVIGAGSELAGIGIGIAAKAGAAKAMGWEIAHTPLRILKEYKTSTREIAKTLLDRGVNVTNRGLRKIDALLDVTEDSLQTLLGGVPGTINPTTVAGNAKGTVTKTFEDFAETNYKAIQRGIDKFLHHPKYASPQITGVKSVPTGALDRTGQMILRDEPIYETLTDPLTALDANKIKRAYYRNVGNKFGKLSDEVVETRKALARELKSEIEGLAAKAGGVAGAAVRKTNETLAELTAAKLAVAAKIAATPKIHPADFVWIARHPVVASVAFANKLGIPVASLTARVLNSAAIPGISPTIVRALTVGLASPPVTHETDPASAGSPGTRPNPGPGTPGRAPLGR